MLELSEDDKEEETLDSFFSELIEADNEEELSIGLEETLLWLSWDWVWLLEVGLPKSQPTKSKDDNKLNKGILLKAFITVPPGW